MSEDTVNHSQVGNVFMLGPGGLATIILSAYFGRLPVLFYFVILALATAIWCSAATSFESFMAARILNGFFSTVAQGVSGPSITNFSELVIKFLSLGWSHVHQRHFLFP